MLKAEWKEELQFGVGKQECRLEAREMEIRAFVATVPTIRKAF